MFLTEITKFSRTTQTPHALLKSNLQIAWGVLEMVTVLMMWFNMRLLKHDDLRTDAVLMFCGPKALEASA